MAPIIAAERRIEVGGMTCAACVARVERALKAAPGVLSASVNLATERAVVAVAEDRYPDAAAALVAAIERIGYEAHPIVGGEPPAASEERLRAADRHDRARVLAGVALSSPLVVPMLAVPFGLHVMLPGLLQLALATPVQFWLGARFYRAGWRALRDGAGNMDLLVALGTSAAYGLSLWDLAAGAQAGQSPHLYFEASTIMNTLMLLGK